jgi:hypothetical protein
MYMPKAYGITAGQTHEILIGSLGNDYSATTREGFHLTSSGSFSLLL